jgi:hypothetical protein
VLGQLNEIFIQFNEFAKSSPVVAGIAGLWGASVVTFFLRGIPSRIFEFIKRQTTTTLVVNNHDNVYYSFLKWSTENNLNTLVRNLHFGNNKDGYGKGRITIGYGQSFFFFGRHIFRMSRNKEDAAQTREVKESITVTVLGRNHKIFDQLFTKILEMEKKDREKKKETLEINVWRHDYWRTGCTTYLRPMSTIILNKETRNNITGHIDEFLSDKDWYMKNGIPYRTGILLSGPPGTGKTSLLKGLCTHYGKDLYLLQLDGLTDKSFLDALSSVPPGSVIAIEDIDTCHASSSRVTPVAKSPARAEFERAVGINEVEATKDDSTSSMGLTLSGLLNGIDGVASGDDRILIATTNHPEKLDPALIRDGRFDLKVEIGYVSMEMLHSFFEKFYPDTKIPSDYKIKAGIAPCEVQTLIFKNRDNPEIVLEKLLDKPGKTVQY